MRKKTVLLPAGSVLSGTPSPRAVSNAGERSGFLRTEITLSKLGTIPEGKTP
jgi:hypothetical protein